MLLAQKNEIRNLPKKQYGMLLEMCRHANSLANVGEYHIRHFRSRTGKYLSYAKNCTISRHNANYKMLQANIAQQTLKRQDKKHQSFFALLKAKKNGSYDGPVNPPHFRKKGGYDSLIIPGQYAIFRDDTFVVPMSREFRKKHGNAEIVIPIPERLRGYEIHQIELIPSKDGSFMDAVFTYEVPDDQNLHLPKTGVLSLDPGLDNFMTGVCTNGTTFIIDGRHIKSINQWYNKQKAEIQSKLMDVDQHWSKKLTILSRKREHRVVDFMHKAVREVVRMASVNRCGTIVIGFNRGQKQNANMGRVTNQNFVQIPHARFRRMLKAKCEQLGIAFIEQEESYTSKASALDGDRIPTYGDGTGPHTFSGKRIKRGLYRASDGTVINADVNGALNIARKSKQNGLLPRARLCRGALDAPARIRIV